MASPLNIRAVRSLQQQNHRGNLAPIRACLKAMVGETWNANVSAMYLVFGYAGCGKTTLIDSIGYDLRRSFPNAQIARLSCHDLRMTSSTPDGILSIFTNLRRQLTSLLQNSQVLLFLDEFEAISTGRAQHQFTSPMDVDLRWCCRSLIDGLDGYKGLAVTIATNYPSFIDELLGTFIGGMLYLPIPDLKAIEGIMASSLVGTDANVLAYALFDICHGNDLWATTRGIKKGLALVQRLGYIKNRRLARDANTVAGTMVAKAAGGYPPANDVQRYQDIVVTHRARSELLLRTYSLL